MSKSLRIRDATPADLPTVHAVTQAAYEQIKPIIGEQAHVFGETMDDLAQRMADGWTIVVAERNGQIVGTVRCRQHEGEMYLGRLAVLPAVQHVGVGRALVAAVEQRGLEVLRTNPIRIDMQLLLQFAEFRAFRERQRVDTNQQPVAAVEEDNGQDPEETLGTSYQKVRQTLAQDVLERVKGCTPRFFERLVVELLVAMGYGGSLRDAGQAVGQSGDGGIDGIIKEDRLGLNVVYIQAKRWEGTVGRPVVQGFAGSLEGERANKGVLITTSSFAQEAKDYVRRIQKKIVLIDGEQLAQFMIDHDVGVAHAATYIVKRIDSDYFEEA